MIFRLTENKGIWDVTLAWVGTITALTTIGTVVAILSGLLSMAFTIYRWHKLHEEDE